MSSLSICSCCGRTMDATFVFCPWCGTSKIASRNAASLDAHIENVRDEKHYEQEHHIIEIGNKIDNLERELSVIVLSAEMHK